MPDLLNRAEYEQITAAALASLMDQQRRRLETLIGTHQPVTDSYWQHNERETAAALYMLLLPVYENAANRIHRDPLGNMALAREWAQAQSTKLAADVTEQNKTYVADLMEKAREALTNTEMAAGLAMLMFADGASRLGPALVAPAIIAAGLPAIFSKQRAYGLGRTEITRANSTGEMHANRRRNRIFGIVRHATWRIDPSSNVCPICSKLNGHSEIVWRETYPDGPPGHPHCACWLDFDD